MSDMPKYESHGVLYRVRGYLLNDEFDLILENADDKKELTNMSPKEMSDMVKRLRPILATYIIDPKVPDVNKLPSELTWQILMDILKVELPRIMTVISGMPSDQKKS